MGLEIRNCNLPTEGDPGGCWLQAAAVLHCLCQQVVPLSATQCNSKLDYNVMYYNQAITFKALNKTMAYAQLIQFF
jgi:hypothetical protein